MSDTGIEESSGNVFADLGFADAGEMKVKAKLAQTIHEIIKQKKISQQKAAVIVGLTQPKLSLLLRGQFRGISETKMIQCLNSLGRDVDIVIKPRQHMRQPGRVEVVCA